MFLSIEFNGTGVYLVINHRYVHIIIAIDSKEVEENWVNIKRNCTLYYSKKKKSKKTERNQTVRDLVPAS